MSLQKLQRQLTNDLKKSPKKAAALAALAGLCAWFWIPLLLPKAPPQPAAAAAPPASAAGPSAAAAAAPPAAAAASAPEIPWQELNEQIEGDPLMRPADLAKLAEVRNPFAMTAVIAEQKRVAEAEEQAKHGQGESPAEPPHETTPDEAGLVLSSTLVGSNKRAALINGRVYEEGADIQTDGGSNFRLAHIEAQRVLLERAGQRYPLTIKRRKAAGRVEIRPLSN